MRVYSDPLQQEQIMFLHSSTSSGISPHIQSYPIWMDYAVKDIIKEAPKYAPLHYFQAFHLHWIMAVAPDKPSGGLAPYVYTPPL